MDAIAAHQAGFDNVVATMGTSLTERQVRLVKRQAGRIVLALDADAAGNEAAVRGHDVVEQALREDGGTAVAVVTWRGLVRYQDAAAVDLRVAVLPQGSDPDDVIRSNPETWRNLIDSAPPVIDYRFEAAATRHDLGSPGGRSTAVQELLPLLEPLTDPVLRAHYLQRLSRLSLVREEELSAILNRKRSRPQARFRQQNAADTPNGETESTPRTLVLRRADSRPEAFLVALLLRYPQIREEGLELSPELLWDSANRAVLETWKRHADIEMVKESLEDELKPHFMRLVEWRLFPPDDKVREALADCRARLEERQLRVEKQAMAALVAASEEQLGPSAIVQAAASELQTEDEPMKEAVVLHRQDMEAGLKLHTRERKGDSGVPATGQDPGLANNG